MFGGVENFNHCYAQAYFAIPDRDACERALLDGRKTTLKLFERKDYGNKDKILGTAKNSKILMEQVLGEELAKGLSTRKAQSASLRAVGIGTAPH